jgi:Ca-activated chloride channel family protein
MRKLAALTGLAALFACALAGCGSGGSGTSGDASPAAADAQTLNVIAGSELHDLEPYLDQIQAKTGVRLALTYSGTLAGIDRIRGGEAFDAAWFANARYLLLQDDKHRVKAQERIMLSPVILGVKESKAKAFGWTGPGVTWKAIAAKAGSGEFRFAMTNPASSNSGFSAVIAVASALAGTADALRASDVDAGKLRAFFRGQTLTAGSSGWLADAYVRQQDDLDGMINYEASLLALNRSGKLKEPFTLIYPKEGVVTADYPLLLLDESKRDAYEKVVAYLTSADFQRTIVDQTFRRPVNPSVKATGISTAFVNEVAFPSTAAAVDGILLRYLNDNRVPAHSFYVIDTSGSMEGDRIEGVRSALDTLAGSDTSLTGKFARFDDREKITLISFSSQVTQPLDLEMHGSDDAATLTAVRNYAAALNADGSTAIYCALESALDDAARARATDGGRYDSIVLMTDGENNRCDSEDDFARKYRMLPARDRIKIFPILFGEGDPGELQRLADLTGGRLFDAKTESLASVFKEIRGYQ